MPSVSAEIERIIKAKDALILSGFASMRDILKELRSQVQVELGASALSSWDAYSLKTTLNAIERRISDASGKAESEISGLTDRAWVMGAELVDAPISTSGIYVGFNISSSAIERLAMKEFAGHITQNLYGDAWARIKSELTLGVLGGKTPQDVAKAIGLTIPGPSIFASIEERAMVITKTEMGRTFSKATQSRMEEAASQVDGLEKQWLHKGHPRVARPYHLALNGLHIPVDEPFLVGNVAMMFPRDPKAPINEVINCGCDHVPYHSRWVDGLINGERRF